ncbi:MAG: aldose 1-epimerase family protein [Lachnospiraceae bacterium]|nr:aldose 1-epimerase family protein [Lachnospiraceae bacterium]
MQTKLSYNGGEMVIQASGAEMISYQKDGVKYLWEGSKESWGSRSPILFPIVCSLKDNTILIDGVSYNMEKHGFARRNEFDLVTQTDTEAVFVLEETAETLAQYPYRFKLTVTHALTSSGFSTRYEVLNKDDKPMPFCIGGHPGLLCPIGGEGSFEDYDLVFPQIEDNEPLKVDERGLLDGGRRAGILKNTDTVPLSYPLFAEDALIFDELKSRSVMVKNRHTGRAIRFDFAGYPVLGVWTTTARNEPYICLEPWVGVPAEITETGNFEDKPYAVTLAPSENFSVSYALTVL